MAGMVFPCLDLLEFRKNLVLWRLSVLKYAVIRLNSPLLAESIERKLTF